MRLSSDLQPGTLTGPQCAGSDRRLTTIHALFAARVAERPAAVAVEAESSALTYADLDERAERLARGLAALGVGPEVTVGLATERQPAAIVGMLGILKAGGAYVPLDPAYPRERFELLLRDAGCAVLVRQEGLALPGSGLPELSLHASGELAKLAAEAPPRGGEVEPDGLAYVMYTSGSTGRPKGVEVAHRGVVRLVHGADYARFGPDEVFLHLAPASFDAATFEVWGALLNGGRLALAPPRTLGAAELAAVIQRHGVTTLWLTAGLFHQMVEEKLAALEGLAQLLAGGDVLSPAHVRRVLAELPGTVLINGYGPTENTTFTCCHTMASENDLGETVPIGRPIAGTTVRLLDGDGREARPGSPGELATGGLGLARGYRGRPAATAAAFVPHPWSRTPGERLYLTGDLARERADGAIEFLGRRDLQVKIRGFRVEPGEVESALRSHPQVADAAVVVRDDLPGGRGLVGFVVAREGAALPSGLREFLQAKLPAHLVPAFLAALPRLPLTPNGKVDRRALAAVPMSGTVEATDEPGGPLEAQVAAIWRECLGLLKVGREDDFFALGGQSLVASRVALRLAELVGFEPPLAVVFEHPTVAAQARWLSEHRDARSLAPRRAVAHVAGEEHPASFAQRRLWLADRVEKSSAYNMPVAVRLTGALDPRTLEAALSEIVRRHEPLRTVFAQRDGEVVQIVLPAPAEGGLRRLSLASLPAERRAAAVEAVLDEAGNRPFDLAAGPVVRFLLLAVAAEEHVLLAAFHHVAADGWSMGVFFRELAALYGAFARGLASPLPPLAWRYAEVSAEQHRAAASEAWQGQLAWWREELAGLPELELPSDRPASEVRGASAHAAATRAVDVPLHLAAALQRLGLSEGITPYVTLLSSFAVVLGRLAGQGDFALGLPAAGRTWVESEGMIGFFVNTLCLRFRLDDDPTFHALLRRVRDRLVAAQVHQDVPFEVLIEELRPARSGFATPFFRAMCSYFTDPGTVLELPGLKMELVGTRIAGAKFDLTLSLLARPRQLVGALEYRAALFDPATMERLLQAWLALLAAAAENPRAPLSELPLFSPAQQAQLSEWNDTAEALPYAALHELVWAQVARTPTALAIDGEDGRLTYAELGRRADALAGRLGALGVGPESVVGLCAHPSVARVVGLLAVLRAGGAWLPLSPDDPPERLAALVRQAGARVALAGDGLEGLVAVDTVVSLSETGGEPLARPAEAGPDSLAAVLFTSGSTGQPKGVMLTHGGLVNRLLWAQRVYRLGPRDAVLAKAPFTFDFSIWECFAPLISGARLVPARPVGHRDPAYLVRRIREAAVTFVHFVPTLLAAFLEEDGLEDLTSLRQVFSGGEALTAAARDRCLARLGVPLDNQYGPTEISIDTTRWTARSDQPQGSRVPIGRPIGNARLHLLDRRGLPVPVGAVGRLHVGGAGVARGYLGRPELTAERFVPDPWGRGERLYDTGDLGRYLPDGNLEFVGRADAQIKLRGVRIEPGEVEAALRSHPEVHAAAVALDPAGERLIAYVVGTEGGLRDHLRTILPEALVPHAFVTVSELPRTASGKLDRRALAALAPPVAPPSRHGFAEPAAELLAQLFADVLARESVRGGDDFFALGGHSLAATRLLARVRRAFGVELSLADLFAAPTPAALARKVAATGEAALPPILPVPRQASGLPLSFAQQRLWLLHRLEPASTAYHVAGAVRLEGPLDRAALGAAFAAVVARHEALRTVFRDTPAGPLQIALPPPPEVVQHLDLSGLVEGEGEAERVIAAAAHRPFDLALGPLLRVLLVRLAPAEHLLAVVLHHVVSDAWSHGVLLAEVSELYAAALAGRPAQLPELAVQYADYAVWQREVLAGERLERAIAYWRETLAGAPVALDLPADRQRPAVATFAAGHTPLRLDGAAAAELSALCRRQGWTPFMAHLGLFAALLARLSCQRDVPVGAPFANRGRHEIDGLIGFFTNTLVLRLAVGQSETFAVLGDRAREVTLAASAHQELPFELLVAELAPQRDLTRTPLFQALLVVLPSEAPPSLAELTARAHEVRLDTAKFDLTLFLVDGPQATGGLLEWNRDLFDPATAERLAGWWHHLVAGAAAEPERPLAELPLSPAAERAQLVAWGSNEIVHRPALVHHLVAEQARRHPEADAVVRGDQRITYGELVSRARRLARRLAALGVGPDVPVGVLGDRSVEAMVGLLAVLEAGGAFLPLDPALPAGRRRRMLEEARAGAVVTPELLDADEGAGEGTEPAVPLPDHLAYLCFTSGSTGAPKGVAMPHRAAANLLGWQARTSRAGPGTRTLQYAPLAFDVAFQEIFSTWTTGGTLVLVDEATRRDPEALLALLAAQRVERLFLPVVAAQQLAACGRPRGLLVSEVTVAGEQLKVTPALRDFFAGLPGAALANHYGPTETHAASWLALTGDPETWPETPAIGRPIDGARLELFDAAGQPVPQGVVGEIHVGGAGLARGYAGRPELTAERFVPDPLAGSAAPLGARVYATGDLARWTADGELEYKGRRDAQVKVRGVRIEPAEVEAALAGHAAVAGAAVAVHGGGAGARRLVGYVVFREGAAEPSWKKLKTWLAATLPEPMIPTAWVRLGALPLTLSGKLDRRALPAPEGGDAHGFVPPSTAAEVELAALWRELLGVARVGAQDGFFDLGGHSLLATQLVSHLREAFGVELPLRRVFEKPVLADLAAELEGLWSPSARAGSGVRPVGRDRPLPLSFAQERLWFLDRLQGASAAYNIPLPVILRGALSVPALAAAFGEMARRHETLRTRFPDVGGEPVQAVAAAAGTWPLPVVDLSALPEPARRGCERELAERDAERTFDLGRGPLLRTTLVRSQPEVYLLLATMHHIVADGWSLGVLLSELSALYRAALLGEASPLPELAVQYGDFAAWQRTWLSGERLARQVEFWRRQLAGAPAYFELPADRPRPAVQSQRGDHVPLAVPADLASRLAPVAREAGATPFMLLLAAFQALLARYTGAVDFNVGTPVAGRIRKEIEPLIGFFVNTLVLRADLQGEPTFTTLLARVRGTVLAGLAHQDVPFERLVDELQPARDLTHHPVFQMAFALQNAPVGTLDLPGVTLEPVAVGARVAKFDLSVALSAAAGGFAGTLELNTDLFDRTTVVRLGEHFTALLAGIAETPGAPVRSLAFATPAERHQLLAEWNDTEAGPHPEDTDPLLHQLFAARAEADPEALALVWDGGTLTYGELQALANRTANFLVASGVGPSEPVGVWIGRTPEMVAAVLGVLAAGGAYLPIDAAWPAERAAAILGGTGARLLLTGRGLVSAARRLSFDLPALTHVVCLDEPSPEVSVEALDESAVAGLWDHVSETAIDRVTASGFVSSATGKPFSAADVDEYRDRVLALAAPYVGPGKRVLEIGCGAGLILWELAPQAARCVGLDPSPVTQEKNRRTAEELGLAHVELPTGFAHDVERLVEGPFDLVLLASTVQFFPGVLYLERVLEAARKLLAPGGAVLVADVPDPARLEDSSRLLALDAAVFVEQWGGEVHRRTRGFDNELRFRYDVVLPGAAAPPRRRHLWTGWHVAQQPASRPRVPLTPEAIAYVIHTSGSTGAPKGIAVRHRPAVNLVRWVNRAFEPGPGDRLLFVTSLCFDLSVYDVFGTLAAGAAVRLASDAELRDPQRLSRLLIEEPITVWDSAPAALQQLVPLIPAPAPAERRRLRLALLSGDWIPVGLPDQVRGLFAGCRVVSLGGATEATVWSNWYPVGAVEPSWPSIPYGRPIAGARYHVLDERLEPCPIGVPGDLYIGGDCLASVYARMPGATAAAFLPDPFGGTAGGRIYATGDRSRYLADGNLEFLGRADFQVKIRGYRIELEEIEAVLQRLPAVREAAVVAREDAPGDKRLVAYVVPARQPAPTADEIRDALKQTLPEYMVPGAVVVLEALPLTGNGKVDRRALPAPREAQQPARGVTAPKSELERKIAAVWQEVLAIETVGADESFFEVGGSSLLIVKLHTHLKARTGLDVPVVDLFRYPTVAALAKHVSTTEAGKPPQPEREAVHTRTRERRDALRQLAAVRGQRRWQGQ